MFGLQPEPDLPVPLRFFVLGQQDRPEQICLDLLIEWEFPRQKHLWGDAAVSTGKLLNNITLRTYKMTPQAHISAIFPL